MCESGEREDSQSHEDECPLRYAILLRSRPGAYILYARSP